MNTTPFPSSKLLWERYFYRTRSEWIGLVNQADCQWMGRNDLSKELERGMSTWIDGFNWDAAAKWKVSSEDIIAKYRRFAFDGIFKGFRQINQMGKNSTVHLWLESDYYTGGREATFFDLFERIVTKKPDFGWLVINEMLMDVSPKGRFDLIEHAHMIQGPSSTTLKPLVTNIFVSGVPQNQAGEFGTGVDLLDIDEDD